MTYSQKTKAELIEELKALRESEEQFHSLMESSLLGMYIHKDRRLLYVNQAFASLFGYSSSQEALDFKDVLDFYAPFERDRLLGIFKSRVTGGTPPVRYESQGLRKDGSLVWLENFVQLVKWNGEQAILNTVVDISERKRAEEAQKDSEATLKRAQQIAGVGSWVAHVEEGCLEWSEEVYRILGVGNRYKKLHFDTFLKIVHPDDRSMVITANQKCKATGDSYEASYRIVLQDGNVRWMHDLGEAETNSEGKVIRVRGTTQDVTERRNREEELQASKRLLQLVFDTVPNWLFLKDQQGRYQLVNRSMAEFYGKQPEDLVGMTFRDISTDYEEVEAADRADSLLVKTGKPVNTTDLQVTSPDGTKTFRQNVKLPLWNSHGNMIGVIGSSEDITGQKESELALRESEDRFRNLVEGSVLGIIITQDSKPVFVNQALVDLIGYESPDEILEFDSISLIKPDYESDRMDAFREARLRGEEVPSRYEVDFLRKDGSIVATENVVRVIQWMGAPAIQNTITDLTERKRAEEELENSKSMMQAVLDTVPTWLFIKDREGRFKMVNKAMAEFYERRPEDFVTEHYKSFAVSDEEVQASELSDCQVVETGKAAQVENFRVLDPNGSIHFRQGVKLPLTDATGQVVGIVGASVDITERKQAEEEALRSKEILQTVVDTIPHAIYLKDLESRFVLVNRDFADFYGKEPAQLLGIHTSELPGLTKPEKDELTKQDQEVVRRKKTVENDNMALHRKDGSTVIRHVYKVPLIDPENKIQGIVGFSENITERKQAEEKLRNNQRLLEAVFEAIPVGLQVKDREGKYLMVNHAMTAIYGSRPEEITGRTFADLGIGTEEQRAVVAEDDRKVVDLGQRINDLDSPLTLPDGRTIWRNRIKVPLFDDTGDVIGTVGVMEDVTNRKTMEEQLRQAQKMEAVGQLAGGIAHDFNNMLQIIHGYGNLALNREDANLLNGDIHKILKASESAATLTSQLLTFSRKQTLQTTDMALDDLIVNLMKMMERILGEDIELNIVSGVCDGMVHGDRGMIEQVIMNLCVNARDALPNGGRLAVETRCFAADEKFCSINDWAEPVNYAEVNVSDNGSGIPGDKIDRIFEPFFTTKGVGKGTGLGLAVVYGIIEQHKGHIAVYSEPGIGTTFKIYLPLSNNGRPVPKLYKRSEPIGGTETILIAEDQPEVLELAVSILEDYGYSILTAANGEEALGKFEENASIIELVLLDVVMPKMSGTDAYDRMRNVSPSLRALFTTGYSFQALESKFNEGKDLTWIQKPYSPTVLLNAVRKALDAG